MNGRAWNRMRDILNNTGVYRLTGEGPADWEVDACGAGFSVLEEQIDGLLGDLFADSASEGRLDLWEKLFRSQPSGGSLEQRRTMLAGSLSMNPRRFTREDFSAMLPAAGVQGEVLETVDGLKVLLGRLLGVTGAEAQWELDRVLPAHLPWTWEEGVHWAALEAWMESFGALDARGLTWAELDNLTRGDLEAWGQRGQEGN